MRSKDLPTGAITVEGLVVTFAARNVGGKSMRELKPNAYLFGRGIIIDCTPGYIWSGLRYPQRWEMEATVRKLIEDTMTEIRMN